MGRWRPPPEKSTALITAEGHARLKAELESLEEAENAASATVDELALQIPNPAHESVPEGDEDKFELVHEVGDRTPPRPHDHAEIGELFSWQWAGFFVAGTFAFLLFALIVYAFKRSVQAELMAKALQAALIVSVSSIVLFFAFFAFSAFV